MADFKIDRIRFRWRGDWVAGTSYIKDDIVRYGAKIFVSIEMHTADANFYNDLDNIVPRWSQMMDGQSWTGNWKTSNFYKVGEVAKVGAAVYKCIEGHLSNASEANGLLGDENKWVYFARGEKWTSLWQPNTLYNVGETIVYGGSVWKCITSHTSSTTAAGIEYHQANWVQYHRSDFYRGYWAPNIRYYPDDIVRNGGVIYRAVTGHTSAAVDYWNDLDSTDYTTNSSSGSGAVINVFRVGTTYYVKFTNAGVNFAAAETISIVGSKIGGADGTNDLSITINTVNSGAIATTSANGTAVSDSAGLEADQAKWEIVLDGIEYEDDWAYGKKYNKGALVSWSPGIWQVTTSHWSITEHMNEANFSLWVPGAEYEGTYSTTQYYQKGDVVHYGGYSYVALVSNTNIIPGVTDSTNTWELIQTGYNFRSEWNSSTAYKTGDVVRAGGNLFIAVQDSTGADPDTTFIYDPGSDAPDPWQLLVTGKAFKGSWKESDSNGAITYFVGDVVTVAGTVYACIKTHESSSSDSKPTLDEESENVGPYWVMIAKGNEPGVLVLEQIGDVKSFDTEKTRIGLGTVGQLFKGNATGDYPIWGDHDVIKNVFFVSPYGTDTPTSGKSVAGPFKTIKYACDFVAADLAERTPCTIAIKTGVYEEILPITVPRDTHIWGDFTRRGVNVRPKAGYTTTDMWRVNNACGIANMTMQGKTGGLTAANEYGTKRTTGGAYVTLDPGSGPADTSVHILTKSPYIKNCSIFGTGCTGLKVDGDLHNAGLRSFVANDTTHFIENGIGAHVNGDARVEFVSVFAYYAHIGYLATGGGKFRATNGNSSYGDFGCVAEGQLAAETPTTGKINNQSQEAQVDAVYNDENEIFAFAYDHAGQDYSSATINIFGSGEGAAATLGYDQIRNGGVGKVRIKGLGDSSTAGGSNYTSEIAPSQGGDATSIKLAQQYEGTSLETVGQRIYIWEGTGRGQYGYVHTYDPSTKVATIKREFDDTDGWQHVMGGFPIETLLNASTKYSIEPRITFTDGPYNKSTPSFGTTGEMLVSASGRVGASDVTVLLGNGKGNRTTDGTNWTAVSGVPLADWIGMTRTANYFIAVAQDGTTARSADGATWTNITTSQYSTTGGTYTPSTGELVLEIGAHEVGQTYSTTSATYTPATGVMELGIEKHTPGAQFTPSAATYTPATGVLELTIGSHSLVAGNKVKIAPNSLTFTCALDSHATEKTYPRATGSAAPGGVDYFYEKAITLTSVGATTITMNVGDTSISGNNSTHTFVSATSNSVTEQVIGAHNLHIGNEVKIAPTSLSFTCSFDDHTAQTAYPRATGSAAPGGYDYYYYSPVEITATTASTITMNVGKGNIKNYTVTDAAYTPATGVVILTIGDHNLVAGNHIDIAPLSLTFTCAQDSHGTEHSYPRATGSAAPGGYDYFYNKQIEIISAGATTITVNVGISSNTTAHTFISALADGVSNSNTHTFVTALANNVTLAGQFVMIAPNSLGFTCSFDNNVSTSTYPRATGSAAPGGMDYFYDTPIEIQSRTATTITMNVGKGNIKSYTPTAAVYTPASGVMVLTIGAHSLIAGNYVDIATDSLTFTCDQDSHGSNHTYPRATGSAAPGGYDYYYEKPIRVESVGATTITLNVGISSNTTDHLFVSATADCVTNSNAHTYVSATANNVSYYSVPVDVMSGIAYRNGTVIIASETGMVYKSTDDGSSFSADQLEVYDGSTSIFTYIAAGNGLWIAGNGTGKTYESQDEGTTWSLGSNIGDKLMDINGVLKSVHRYDVTSLIFGGGKFVATVIDAPGDESTVISKFMISNATGQVGASEQTATRWTESETPPHAGPYIGVAYTEGTYVAISAGGDLAYSYDAWSWKILDSALTGTFSSIGSGKAGGGHFVPLQTGSTGTTYLLRKGSRPLARAITSSQVITKLQILSPGSGYSTAPAVTITDNKATTDASLEARIFDGVLGQPEFSNRGSGFMNVSATLTGDGFADEYQIGPYLQVKDMNGKPGPGAILYINGLEDQVYRITQVNNVTGNSPNIAAQFRITPRLNANESPDHETTIEIRERYSQVRITGHDFLDIGTGNKSTTNYPGLYTSGYTPGYERKQQNETVSNGGGRVFYTSTDQDGNYRVGELFEVEQSTGIVTLNADLFDLSGLTEITLGAGGVGGTDVKINEFSTDPTLKKNSNNVIPTQKAIATFVGSRVSGGGANLITNEVRAGQIKFANDQIFNEAFPAAGQVVFAATVNISNVSGPMLAQSYFFGSNVRDSWDEGGAERDTLYGN